jgi:hypothetical protein
MILGLWLAVFVVSGRLLVGRGFVVLVVGSIGNFVSVVMLRSMVGFSLGRTFGTMLFLIAILLVVLVVGSMVGLFVRVIV